MKSSNFPWRHGALVLAPDPPPQLMREIWVPGPLGANCRDIIFYDGDTNDNHGEDNTWKPGSKWSKQQKNALRSSWQACDSEKSPLKHLQMLRDCKSYGINPYKSIEIYQGFPKQSIQGSNQSIRRAIPGSPTSRRAKDRAVQVATNRLDRAPAGDSAVDGTQWVPNGKPVWRQGKMNSSLSSRSNNQVEWQQHAAEKSTNQLTNWSLELPNGSNQHFLRHRSLSTAVKAFLPLSGCEQPEQDLKITDLIRTLAEPSPNDQSEYRLQLPKQCEILYKSLRKSYANQLQLKGSVWIIIMYVYIYINIQFEK